MVAKIFSASPIGYDGSLIEVEGDSKAGLPSIQIVGMGNKSIDEAKERVRSAIANSYLEFPAKKVTINLAPAELPKDGTQLDLAIALAILTCSGQIKQQEVNNALFVGELSLDGHLRPTKGIINIAETAQRHGIETLYVPAQNVQQALLIENLTVIGVTDLKSLYLHLKGEIRLLPAKLAPQSDHSSPLELTIDHIKGQDQAKRALVIAAAGHHNILFGGPPGSGKTMLAKVLRGLLPPLSPVEQIAVTKLHSLGGEVEGEIIRDRPFRSPHHTASQISLIGGGNKPKPGEISLAHLGVLFLDEIPEFARSTLESLRQPLEDKRVSISRAGGKVTYPSDFMLVATMNPCPCGYYGDATKECTCAPGQIDAYQKRLSGPFLDRIDMSLQVSRLPSDVIIEPKSMQENQHSHLLDSISIAKQVQNKRYHHRDKYNGSLSGAEVQHYIPLPDDAKQLMRTAMEKLDLSARSYFKIIKVARTIADIENSDAVLPAHIAEALQYREMSR